MAENITSKNIVLYFWMTCMAPMFGRLVSDELEKIWKETVVT